MRISASRNRLFWNAGDRLTEGGALVDVLERPAERGLGGGDAGGGDRQPLLRQVVHQVDEALALGAQQVRHRHLARR